MREYCTCPEHVEKVKAIEAAELISGLSESLIKQVSSLYLPLFAC